MVRCASRFVGQAVFFDAGKPQGAGYAGGAAERVALIQGVESKQSGQGIAGDAAPKRSCAEGTISRFQSRSLMMTSVACGQCAALSC